MSVCLFECIRREKYGEGWPAVPVDDFVEGSVCMMLIMILGGSGVRNRNSSPNCNPNPIHLSSLDAIRL